MNSRKDKQTDLQNQKEIINMNENMQIEQPGVKASRTEENHHQTEGQHNIKDIGIRTII